MVSRNSGPKGQTRREKLSTSLHSIKKDFTRSCVTKVSTPIHNAVNNLRRLVTRARSPPPDTVLFDGHDVVMSGATEIPGNTQRDRDFLYTKAANKQLRAALDEAVTEVSIIVRAYDCQVAKADSAKRAEDRMVELQRMVEEAEERAGQAQREMKELRELMEAERRRAAEAEARANESVGAIGTLRQQRTTDLDDLREQYRQATAQNEENWDGLRQGYEAQNQTLRDLLTAAGLEQAQSATRIRTLESDLSVALARAQTSESAQGDLHVELQRSRQATLEQGHELEAKDAALETTARERDQLQLALDAMTRDRDQLQSSLHDAAAGQNKLRREVHMWTSQSDTYHAQLVGQDQNLDQHRAKAAAQAEEIAQLRATVEAQRRDIDEFREAIGLPDETLADDPDEMTDGDRDEAVTDRRQSLTDALDRKMYRLAEENDQLRDEVDDKVEAAQRSAREVRALEEENQKLQWRVRHLQICRGAVKPNYDAYLIKDEDRKRGREDDDSDDESDDGNRGKRRACWDEEEDEEVTPQVCGWRPLYPVGVPQVVPSVEQSQAGRADNDGEPAETTSTGKGKGRASGPSPEPTPQPGPLLTMTIRSRPRPHVREGEVSVVK